MYNISPLYSFRTILWIDSTKMSSKSKLVANTVKILKPNQTRRIKAKAQKCVSTHTKDNGYSPSATIAEPTCPYDHVSAVRQNTEQSTNASKVRPFSDIPGPKGIHRLPIIGTMLAFEPFSKLDSGINSFIIYAFECFSIGVA